MRQTLSLNGAVALATVAILLAVATAYASQGTFDRTVPVRWTVLATGDTGAVAGIVRL